MPKLYAARIGGGFDRVLPVPPCDVNAGACEGAGTAAPNQPGAGTAAFAGPGNPKAKFKKGCPKGKRKVKRKGVVRCVKRHRKHRKRHAHNKRKHKRHGKHKAQADRSRGLDREQARGRPMRAARIAPKLTLALAATTIAAAAFASAASAAGDFAFEPGAFARAHAPLNQAVQGDCQQFQCGQTDVQSDNWLAPVLAAPEVTQAGGHPDFSVHFRFENVGPVGAAGYSGDGHVRTITSDAPAGSIGNPLAVPRCEAAQFHLSIYGACPKESQVGISLSDARPFYFLSPISSLFPAQGQPGLLGFKSFAFTAILTPEVRSDGDYGLRVSAGPLPAPLADIYGNTVTLWGVPHDLLHDGHRVNDLGVIGGSGSHLPDTPIPFLTAPTNCDTGPLDFTLKADTWEDQEHWIETTSSASEQSGCDQIKFTPTLSAQPTTHAADQPTGLEVDLHTPQNNQCVDVNPGLGVKWDCGLATSHLKDTKVTLPPGLVINPSGANGLDGCSTQEIGLTTPLGVSPQQFTKAQPTCPDAAKIGTVEVDTPLLDAPAPGTVYIADPYDNPFKALTAIYIVVNDKERGFIAKLAGQSRPRPGHRAAHHHGHRCPAAALRALLSAHQAGPPRAPAHAGLRHPHHQRLADPLRRPRRTGERRRLLLDHPGQLRSAQRTFL